MKIDFFVLSGRTLDSEPSLSLNIGRKSILFNTPEGTCRNFLQHKLKFSRFTHICLTSNSCKSSGGLLNLVDLFNPTSIHFLCPQGFPNSICLNNYFEFQTTSQIESSFMRISSIQLSKTVSFQVQFNEIPGKFSPEKALQLGVSPGPLFKTLSNGKPVELPDKKIVLPSQVLDPPVTPRPIFIIHCSTTEDLTLLNITANTICIHFTPVCIIQVEEYQSFFKHVHSNIFFPQFPIFSFPNAVKPWIQVGPDFSPIKNFSAVSTATVINLIPSFSISAQPPHQISLIPPVIPNPTSFSVTILGSGTHTPNRERSNSSYLIHTPFGKILLDCGENSIGSIRRIYGSTEILKELICIWISHEHGDHVFGLPSLFSEIAEVSAKTIPCFVPSYILDGIMNTSGINGLPVELYERPDRFSFGDIQIESFDVLHSDFSKACRITISNKFSLVFSGDRHPDGRLESNVQKCDLLLHDSTFPDDFSNEKSLIRHSTISQAIQAGNQMKAKYIILTHLSKQIGQFTDDNPNVIFAFDYFTFNFDEHLNE